MEPLVADSAPAEQAASGLPEVEAESEAQSAAEPDAVLAAETAAEAQPPLEQQAPEQQAPEQQAPEQVEQPRAPQPVTAQMPEPDQAQPTEPSAAGTESAEVEAPEPDPPAPSFRERRITEFGDDKLTFVFSDDCWVEVKSQDGENLYSDLNRAGRTLVLSGRAPFRILLGYAPGVSLSFNGEPVPLERYSRNNVANLVLGE